MQGMKMEIVRFNTRHFKLSGSRWMRIDKSEFRRLQIDGYYTDRDQLTPVKLKKLKGE